MKKNLLLRIALLSITVVFFCAVHAQEPDTTEVKCGKLKLDKETFNKLLRQQFSAIATGKASQSVGNYASVDIKDAKVDFAGNSVFENGSVLNIKASGAIKDGLFSAFSNSSLNSELSLSLQYNFLHGYRRVLNYDCESVKVRNQKLRNILADYYKRVEMMGAGTHREVLNLRIRNLIEESRALTAQLASIRTDSTSVETSTKISYQLLANRIELDSLSLKRDGMSSDEMLLDQLLEQKNNSLKMLDESTISVLGFEMGWFSIGYKVNSKAFKSFDTLAVYNEQVSKEKFVGHEVSVQYNHYKWNKAAWESYFWTIGLALGVDDNQSALSKQEVSDVRNFSGTTGQRSLTDKYEVYVGKYRRHLQAARVYADAYYFLFSDNQAAFHFFPEFSYKSDQRPVYNAGIGILYAFKSNKAGEETTKINAEVFYNFLDMNNALDQDQAFWERNNIGLRFTFPITFK